MAMNGHEQRPNPEYIILSKDYTKYKKSACEFVRTVHIQYSVLYSQNLYQRTFAEK